MHYLLRATNRVVCHVPGGGRPRSCVAACRQLPRLQASGPRRVTRTTPRAAEGSDRYPAERNQQRYGDEEEEQQLVVGKEEHQHEEEGKIEQEQQQQQQQGQEEDGEAAAAWPGAVSQSLGGAAPASSTGYAQAAVTGLPDPSAASAAAGTDWPSLAALGSSSAGTTTISSSNSIDGWQTGGVSAPADAPMPGNWPTAYGAPYPPGAQRPPVPMIAGPRLDVVSFNREASNFFALTGRVAPAPWLVYTKGGKVLAHMVVNPIVHEDKNRNMRKSVQVQVWDDEARSVLGQVQEGSMVAVEGYISHNESATVQPYGGAAITVTANYVALLDATPLPRQFYWEYYEGTFERNFPGIHSRTAREDVVAWCSRVPLQQLATQRRKNLSYVTRSILEGRYLLEARAQNGAPSLPFDWQRLLGELGVGDQLLPAIKEGLKECRYRVDKQQLVRLAPVRDVLLADPTIGRMVKEQESATGEKSDLTYAQIVAVRAGVMLGFL